MRHKGREVVYVQRGDSSAKWLFWGAVLGIITFNFQHRKAMAAMLALCIYVAAVPAQIVPHGDWAAACSGPTSGTCSS